MNEKNTKRKNNKEIKTDRNKRKQNKEKKQ